MTSRIRRAVRWPRNWARLGVSALKSLGKRKIFCVGMNKTGTTSLAKTLEELGIIVGKRWPAERLIRDWARRDFRRIVHFCRTAQAFGDIPFSLPFTFQALDAKFPGSRFILTVRDSPEQWYSSLTRFHAKLFGGGRTPTYEDLRSEKHLSPGWRLFLHQAWFPTPDDDLYNKEILIDTYVSHNDTVSEYFRHRPDDLLVLNVAEGGAYKKFCQFINKSALREEFSWELKTDGIVDIGPYKV